MNISDAFPRDTLISRPQICKTRTTSILTQGATWRRQRTEGVLSALTPQKRGRKASARHPLRAENETLRKENTRLTMRLKQAELIIDVQKKVSEILGIPLATPEEGGRA